MSRHGGWQFMPELHEPEPPGFEFSQSTENYSAVADV